MDKFTHYSLTLAGRVGFEPTVDRSPQRFSRPPQSSTLAPPPVHLRNGEQLYHNRARRAKKFLRLTFFQPGNAGRQLFDALVGEGYLHVLVIAG